MSFMSVDRPNPRWVNLIQKYRSLIIPLAFVSLLGVLLVPMPPLMMDVMIAINLAVAIIMLLTTMYMEEPLDFSVFPSLLLATTLLRLVLNIASTRL
ncbi:MAG: FHIPEP family type III secretion protein, partial [Phycisphaerales bacterium]